jgi:transposase
VTPTGTAPKKPTMRAGVDLGLRVLATIADTDGNIINVPNPAPVTSGEVVY